MKIKEKQLATALDANALFSALTQQGQAPYSFLYELNDGESRYGHISLGLYSPSLLIRGKRQHFTLEARDKRGELMLATVAQYFPTQAQIEQQSTTQIAGSLHIDHSLARLEERLQRTTHADFLRAALKACQPDDLPQYPLGLFGAFGYDFVRQFEELPENKADLLDDDDYCFMLATRLFIIDHAANTTRFISLYPNEDFAAAAQDDVEHMLAHSENVSSAEFAPLKVGTLNDDTNFEGYSEAVTQIQQHIRQGDAFQVVYGRMQQATFSGNPLAIYQHLQKINPSPYHFFMHDGSGTLVGASPELAVRVNRADGDKAVVQISPIAGTKPRTNTASDARHAIALRNDPKELSEHAMLIDLARNDIAAIARPATTKVTKAFEIHEFSHVRHLVSAVHGELDENYDALTAYLATMNMGTLTGAPKPSALKIIANYETNARGYFGGGLGFITFSDELETCITIRTLRTKNQKVFLRAAGGIVADSTAAGEWPEGSHKMRALAVALEELSHD